MIGLTLALLLSVTPAEAYTAASSTCAAEPIKATGTKYYACECLSGAAAGCTVGNDANAGTSPSAPLRTLSAAATKFRAMNAGDTVALCRGGKFSGSSTGNWGSWENSRCATGGAANPCILRDYAAPWNTGSESKPLITFTGEQSAVLLGNYGGIRFLNIDWVNTSAGTSTGGLVWAPGFQVAAAVDDIEICNNKVDGFFLGYYSGGCGARHNIRGSQFLNNSQGVLVEEVDSTHEANIYDNNGHDSNKGGVNLAAARTHTWYLGCRCECTGVTFKSNQVYRSAMSGGVCHNAMVTMQAQITGAVIENNYLESTTGAGSECGGIFTGSTYEAGFHGPRNVQIKRNHLVNFQAEAMGSASSANLLVENNIIVATGDWSGNGQIMGFPHYPVSHESATSDVNTANVIRNNTIYFSGTGASGMPAIWTADYGSGYVVANNAVYSTTPLAQCYRVTNRANLAATNNNLCSGPTNWILHSGTNYSLANWRTLSGFDGASMVAAPLFVNAPTDLAPQAGSPLVGAGSNTYKATTDIFGTVRPTPPGIGAVEVVPTGLTIIADPPIMIDGQLFIRLHGTKPPGSSVGVYKRP